jgi:lipid A 4'-phosphatase
MPTEGIALRVWLVSVVLTLAVFGIWPQLDLALSGLFYDPAQGFWLAQLGVVEGLRTLIWDAAEVFLLLAAVGLTAALVRRRPAIWLPARVWGFVLALFGAGPGIVVNGLLKEFWGRARPDAVAQFGGDRMFTAPFLPTDQCAHNCSFVSGEAAAAMAMGIGIYVILRHLRPRLSPGVWWAGVGIAVAAPVLGAALRVIAGRHFLSDVICAGLIVAGLALLLDRLVLRTKPLPQPRFPRTPRRENAPLPPPDPVLTSPATPPIRRDT